MRALFSSHAVDVEVAGVVEVVDDVFVDPSTVVVVRVGSHRKVTTSNLSEYIA